MSKSGNVTDSMTDLWTFFVFPLNILLAAVWVVLLIWLRNTYPGCIIVRFLLSPFATVSSILLLLISCLWIGISGDREFTGSIIFVLILFYVQSTLILIILRGWKREDGVRWRFLMLHCGLLIAVGAGFWGSPDTSEYRIRLKCDEASREAYRIDGRRTSLPYELTVIDLNTEYSVDGKPTWFEALVAVDDRQPVLIAVNNPYSPRFGDDIYLSSISEDTCILQIVREPWRYVVLAGIIMLLAGAFLLFIQGPVRK